MQSFVPASGNFHRDSKLSKMFHFDAERDHVQNLPVTNVRQTDRQTELYKQYLRGAKSKKSLCAAVSLKQKRL